MIGRKLGRLTHHVHRVRVPCLAGTLDGVGNRRGSDAARDRLAMLSALGAALAIHGLRVRAAGLWSGFQISTQSGRFENARTLDEAWAAAEKMLGHAVDPLDPRFIA
jgi:hypothetical protein